MSFWKRWFTPEPVSTAPLACSFCGATQQQVRKLVAGPSNAYICDECIRYSLEIVERETSLEDRVAAASWMLLRELASLGARSPRAKVRKLVLAALALAEGDAAACRQVAAQAYAAGDPEGASLALQRIPEGDRTPDDAIDEACYLDLLGAHPQAVALLDGLDPASLSPVARELVPLHRALMRLRGGLAAADEARALEELAVRFVEMLPTLPVDEAYRGGLVREVRRVRARAAQLAGELVRAEAIMREQLLDAEADAEAWALLHDVHVARGEHDRARIAREHAPQHAHPEGPIAARLRDITTGPFR